jgi:hypothetical protein
MITKIGKFSGKLREDYRGVKPATDKGFGGFSTV